MLFMFFRGSDNFEKEMDEIFNKNLERFLFENNHPNFLFNQPLPDCKKTLMYIACQEGNYQVVEFFLNKNMNPSIKSKINDNEFETCLEVAARWNYIDIVKLLQNPYITKQQKDEIDKDLKTLDEIRFYLLKKGLQKN